MKKPFLYALVAAVYIVFIVLAINTFDSVLPKENLIIPMTMLSLLVLSVAVMGFLFFYEPAQLLIENRKQEALKMFAKIISIFACFVAIFLILLFFINF